MTKHLTSIIEREGDGYVALCPEVDVVSQGVTVDEARNNLKEALACIIHDANLSPADFRFLGCFSRVGRCAGYIGSVSVA